MSDDKTIIADPAGMTVYNPPKRIRACLVQYSGTNLGKRYVLDASEMVVGRAPTANILINEQSVSRNHAKCYQVGDNIEIEDLGSSNGTHINDQRIGSRTMLRDGDIIRFGTILFKYFAHDNIENVFHDKIYRMATIDAVTQTFNKKYLTESLDAEFKFARSYGRDLSVLYFDLDFFKKVNDVYGHNAGDFILKETASLVKSVIRKDDIFCRFGGEEFVVLLPNTNAKVAFDLSERIRATIERHIFKFESKRIEQTISIGVSQLTKDMNEPKDLLADADRKLYLSKANGRNRVTV